LGQVVTVAVPRCSSRHGVDAQNVTTPIAGDVHVYGVGRKGRVCEYPKTRQQTRI